MLPFFAWKIFSISFFISLDFYLQVLSAAKRRGIFCSDCIAVRAVSQEKPRRKSEIIGI